MYRAERGGTHNDTRHTAATVSAGRDVCIFLAFSETISFVTYIRGYHLFRISRRFAAWHARPAFWGLA
jgi:hypothetical protein